MGSKHKADERLSKVYFALCKGFNTPRSLKAWILFREGETKQLSEHKVFPREYLTADSFAADYAITNFVRKNEALKPFTDKRKAAIRSLELSEESCLSTNQRIKLYRSGMFNPMPDVDRVLFAAQRKIARVLGPYDERKWLERCSWGPGATDDMSRNEAYLDDKHVRLPISTTRSAARYFLKAFVGDLHWHHAIGDRKPHEVFNFVQGGIHDTVPKDVTTDRNIEKNPRANIFLQKGVGSYLRSRLLKFGCDLNDQSLNQNLAQWARDLNLCTLDLKNASDSIAIEAVHLLLPIDWALCLADLRTSEVQWNGRWNVIHRFASMGNGFAFELESLIFWAIVSSVEEESGRSLFGVYGDDLICHRENAPLVTRVLSFLGFELNVSKSFVEGEFFESCGKHYYGNRNVTPAYQKERLSGDMELIRCGNRLLRLAARLSRDGSLDKRVLPAWTAVRREITDTHAIGPISEQGDDFLCVPERELKGLKTSANRGRRVWTITTERPLVPAFEPSLLALKMREMHRRRPEQQNHVWRNSSRFCFGSSAVQFLLTTSERPSEPEKVYLQSLSVLKDEPGTLPSRADERERVRKRYRWLTTSEVSTLDW